MGAILCVGVVLGVGVGEDVGVDVIGGRWG